MTAQGQPTLRSSIAAVFRHEWRLLIYAPLTYVFQAGFLVFLAAGIFLIADFYATDETSLRTFLTFLPWVALLMVPALAMRAWVDEPGDRSIELLLTLPLPVGAVVLGKFLAGSALLLVTLLFTAPFPATLWYLGTPDPGVLFAGYLASALLLVSFYAVALLAAALLREQVAAFVCAVALLFLLLLLGWDVFGRLARDALPAGLYGLLTAFSPKFWLDRLARGNLELAGLLYFAAVTGAALLATALVTRSRRRGRLSAAAAVRGAGWTAVLLVALGSLIAAGRALPLALDLTAEREFTLHPGTLKVLADLPPGVEIDLYWSASEPSVPAPIKSHARRLRDHMASLAARAGGRLTLRLRDPKPDSDAELAALGAGLQRVAMTSGDSFYLGAVLRQGGREGRIPYFDLRRAQLLEYDIALALNGLRQPAPAKVGVLSPLILPRHVTEGREGLSFLGELQQAYDLAVVPHFAKSLPEDLDVLLLLDATILTGDMLYALDQFVMGGGGLIVMMDPQVRFNRPSDIVNPDPSAEINDISDLLLKYGLRYRGASVVGDSSLAATVMDQAQQQLSYPYWLRIGPAGLSAAHPVTADLNELFFAEPGAFTFEEDARAQSQALALVTTTPRSGARDRRDFADATPGALSADFAPDGRPRILAAALTGPFASAFGEAPDGRGGADHLSRSQGAPVIFAVADLDWIFDPFALQPPEPGGRLRPANDNLALLLNLVEYAGGDPALIGIRSRGRVQRPFTRVAELFREAQESYRETESELAQRIAAVEDRIAQVPAAAGVTSLAELPAELQAQIQTLQRDLLPLRRELREIRLKMRARAESLGTRLTLANLLAGPLLVLLFWGLVTRLRRRRG